MNNVLKWIILLLALIIGKIMYNMSTTSNTVVPPPETMWGSEDDKRVVPFQISVPDELLKDLEFKLKSTRAFAPPLEGIQHQYGINTNFLKHVINYWINVYNWRQREVFLNQHPHFKTTIQGLKIHFMHIKPKNVPAHIKVLPMLLLHGWPGSIREFYEIIPILTTVRPNKKFVFELIIPSLPGYGFSDASPKPGLGASQTAVIFKNLMKRLGFDTYYVQGGDWGAAIVSRLAIFYPENVRGIHTNMCVSNSIWAKLKLVFGALWPSFIVEKQNEHKLYPLSNYVANIVREFGYMHLQATKPDTLGVALNDSPIGLAAYFLEKFSIWTNATWVTRDDAGLQDAFTYEKLLDNIMIYWVTGSITSSMRLYAESINKNQNVFADKNIVQVPAACAVFDSEIVYQPASIFKDRFANLVHTERYPGGHFAAFEVPETLANDIWIAVSKFESLNNEQQ